MKIHFNSNTFVWDIIPNICVIPQFRLINFSWLRFCISIDY